MNIACPTCNFSSEVSAERLPAATFQARCPRCRNSFTVSREMSVAPQPVLRDALPTSEEEFVCPKCAVRQAPGEICVSCGVVFGKFRPPEVNSGTSNVLAAPPAAESEMPVEEPGWVNIVNIIALLFLLDSSLSLIMRLPGVPQVMASQNGMSFHMKAKYLYDVLMAAGLFVTSFGLSMRKGWARIVMTVLLSLGLAEGLYMMTYQHVAIAELEKNLQENFSELKRSNNTKWVGCLVYLYFIVMLNTRKVRSRFH